MLNISYRYYLIYLIESLVPAYDNKATRTSFVAVIYEALFYAISYCAVHILRFSLNPRRRLETMEVRIRMDYYIELS